MTMPVRIIVLAAVMVLVGVAAYSIDGTEFERMASFLLMYIAAIAGLHFVIDKEK